MSDRAAHVGIQVSKETGNLTVMVKDPDGKPIADAGVEVWHLRGSNLAGDPRRVGTDAAGKIEFKRLPALLEDGKKIPWSVKVAKDGHGPGDANPWRPGEVIKSVTFSAAGKADVVLAPRKAPEPGTKVTGVRPLTGAAPGLVGLPPTPVRGGEFTGDIVPANDNVLVIVCGTPTLTFVPEGNKPYLPVDWKLTPIDPTSGAPRGGPRPIAQPFSMESGTLGAWVSTDTPGLFRLSAHLDGSQAAMLLMFVRVTVKVPGTPACSTAATGGLAGNMVFVNLGTFASIKTAAFSIRPTLSLDVGLSDAELEALPAYDLPYKVKTVGINMCVSSACTGTYANGTVQEAWRPGVTPPVLDTNPGHSSTRGPLVADPKPENGGRQCLIYMHAQTDLGGRSPRQKEFWFSTYDSPVVEFPAYHKNTQAPLTALQGTIEFVMWIGVFSDCLPDMPLVVARCPWTFTASGTGVTVSGDAAKDKPTGVTFGATSGAVTSPGFTVLPGATPAHEAGVPTRAPVYVGGNAYRFAWTP